MTKVGILGGGQLGRMLLECANQFSVETYVLENDEQCPASTLCDHFCKGDIKDFDTVYAFGKQVDCITIEIEQVNVEALEKLEAEGKRIIPKPSVLKTIRNKILQKEFYQANHIPSPAFCITQSKQQLQQLTHWLPAVHKIGIGGYDGKGVQILKNEADFSAAFDAPAVLEKMATIEKEIAVMVAVNDKGETAVYPPVEMVFNPTLNLLDYQLCPALLDTTSASKAVSIATELVKKFSSPGIFAVELFVEPSGEVLVNETAPRVHNSGHHSIEAIATSQFQMLWRVLLQLPLGPTQLLQPSIMVNIIGADGFEGPVHYSGEDALAASEHYYVHLYGKTTTKPGRKMGHVTHLCSPATNTATIAHWIKSTLRAESTQKKLA
jgi:5-(carboxyamino)imidazole ribonucleotide synthase